MDLSRVGMSNGVAAGDTRRLRRRLSPVFLKKYAAQSRHCGIRSCLAKIQSQNLKISIRKTWARCRPKGLLVELQSAFTMARGRLRVA